MRVEDKHVQKKRKERQNHKTLKASACKKISRSFANVNEQLADPTFIQFLSYDSQAVEASRTTSLSLAFSVLFTVFYVLFIVAPETQQKFYSMLDLLQLTSKKFLTKLKHFTFFNKLK